MGPHDGRARWAWRLGSLAAGGLPALAFPEAGWAWLAQVGLIPLLLVVRAAPSVREAAVRGWLGGAGLLAGVHHWLASVTGPLLVVIVGGLGLLWLGWGALAWHLLGGRLTARRVVVAAVGLASGWVLIEVARSWEYLGGPFGLLGASQWDTPAMLAPAALGGVWLVSFLAVAVNTGLAAALHPVGSGGRGGGGGGVGARAAGLAVAVAAAAAGPVWEQLRPLPEPAGQVRVGVVQVGEVQGAQARFDAGLRATRTLAGRGVDLVVWGESSVGADLAARPDLARRLTRLAADVDAALLVNTDARRLGGEGIFKTTVAVTAEGITGRYDKQRLVPFGEYIPLRGLLGWLGEVTDAAEVDRRRGRRLVILQAGGVRVGPLVCFESAFPDLTRHLAARGAQLLVAQSSTQTFQDSWAPEQHASLAAVRAVETGRPMVHATLTGVSTVVDARGRRLLWVPTSRRGAFAVTVPLTQGQTVFVRLGPWLPGACAAALLAGLGIAWARRLPLRRPGGPGEPRWPAGVGRWRTGRHRPRPR